MKSNSKSKQPKIRILKSNQLINKNFKNFYQPSYRKPAKQKNKEENSNKKRKSNKQKNSKKK